MGAGAATQAVPQEQADEASVARLRAMWPAGSKCTIHGLQSAAGQQLNGRSAEVRAIDENTGRLILLVSNGADAGQGKKVKPENVHWEGVVLNMSGEHGHLVEEIQTMVCNAASSPGAVETSLQAELQSKLARAQEVLPAAEYVFLQSFVQQAHSHASQWMTYHEFRINPELKFEGPHGVLNAGDPKHKEMAEQMATTIKRAYWDTAREELAKPQPDFTFLSSRVQELVDTMAGFLPGARRDAFKDRALDFAMLRTQLENRAFDYECLLTLTHRLGNALMELESPFQSERTKAWLDELASKPTPDETGFRAEVIACLSYLFEKCDVLQVEIENFGLQAARATKLQGLERSVFTQMVKTGITNLHATRSWLMASDHGGNVEVAFIKGMTRSLSEKTALLPSSCPEPMRVDLRRLHDLQSGLQGVALIGLVAIVATPFFPSSISSEHAGPIFQAVAQETEKPDPQLSRICEIVEQGVADLRHAQNEAPVDYQKLDDAFGALRRCLGEDVPAFRLLHDRTLKAFNAAMGPPKRKQEWNCLGETWSLRFAAEHLNGVVDKVWSYMGEHLRVYRPLYGDVLSACQPATAGGS